MYCCGFFQSYIKCKHVSCVSQRLELFYDIQLNVKGKKNSKRTSLIFLSYICCKVFSKCFSCDCFSKTLYYDTYIVTRNSILVWIDFSKTRGDNVICRITQSERDCIIILTINLSWCLRLLSLTSSPPSYALFDLCNDMDFVAYGLTGVISFGYRISNGNVSSSCLLFCSVRII